MYSSNQCSGFFIKHHKQEQKQFKLFYFYIDINGIMYFMHNLAKLNYLIRNSSCEKEISDCRISGIKTFPNLDQLPFYHRHCFELQIQQNQIMKQFIVFAFVEEDIEMLQEYLKGGSQKKKQLQEHLSQEMQDQEYDILEKVQLLGKLQGIFKRCRQLPVQLMNEMKQQQDQNQSEQTDEITYTGQTKDEKPEGTGTLFFKSEGISFVGEFRDGQKHGSGYIVDSNLDMIYCEFINDELSGI